MKKRFLLFNISIGLLLGSIFPILNTSQTQALTGSDWRAGNIIADSVFYDNTSMSANDIQNYLNAKVPTCDTYGTQSAADLGYPNLTHAQYAAKNGWPGAPYVCLKDYYQVPRSDTIINNFSGSIPEGAISAAQIIKNAADNYKVSPKTLIVLLTKESPGPLTLDTWPIQSQYKNAMGYACPDTAPCDPAYAGFYNQVMNAAKRIQTYKQYPTSYRHQPYQNNKVYYNPNLTGCGDSSVYIQGYATAGLYNYTPYQPNQAALNNLYGTGDSCSAYGNRNFWRIFNDWFGFTPYVIKGGILEEYNRSEGFTRLGNPIMDESCNLKEGACFQNFERGAIYWTPAQNRGYTVIGGIKSRWDSIGKEWSSLGYPISNEIYSDTNVKQQFQNGIMHYSKNGTFIILSSITNYSAVGNPLSDTICGSKDSGCYQYFDGGTMYSSSSSGSYPVIGGIGAKWSTTGKEWGVLGYPTSSEEYTPSYVRQHYQYGDILFTARGSNYTLDNMKYVSDFSYLGDLRSDTLCGLKNGGCYQLAGNGYIYYSKSSGTAAIFGGIFERWAQLGKEWGRLGYPTTNEQYINGQVVQSFENGSITWTPSKITVQYK